MKLNNIKAVMEVEYEGEIINFIRIEDEEMIEIWWYVEGYGIMELMWGIPVKDRERLEELMETIDLDDILERVK